MMRLQLSNEIHDPALGDARLSGRMNIARVNFEDLRHAGVVEKTLRHLGSTPRYLQGSVAIERFYGSDRLKVEKIRMICMNDTES